jgi:uncharacterized membrane protein YgcG
MVLQDYLMYGVGIAFLIFMVWKVIEMNRHSTGSGTGTGGSGGDSIDNNGTDGGKDSGGTNEKREEQQ